ncbi:MAG: N-acetylated-alpha-linked acidic dipeptidase [Candidatus Eremiobacteraeota bacterium]|nr:N-acetylated-alpha-linked acidic dipeptidase [Candidatus Eremiobacteraeota bacterium]
MQALRLLAASLAAAMLLGVAPPAPILGFGPAANARERVDEARFLDLPSAQGALDHAAVFGAHPHYAGTPADHALALYARDRLREYGFEARLEEFDAVVDTPRRLALELYSSGQLYVPRNGAHRARGTPPLGLDLREAGDPIDPATLDPAVGLPFNAGSGDGDLVAPLVYAHRGSAEDYAALARAGVDVRGTVVLVRYGGAFRGLLARAAQDAGAAGAILYDDPADDGAGKGPTYPDGPWRPAASVQRGTLGPGIRIPVLPVSAANARVLLRALRGPAGPAGWAGALDAPYPLAKGPAWVHLVVQLNRTRTTLWNTVGVLRGTQPGASVMLGAHRDAWVYGVGDNGAGSIVLLEAARGLGYLARSGWRPKRSLVVALWDGEEIGLLGSAAYARAHDAELRHGCAAYLNADQNVTGSKLEASAAGALGPALIEASRAVADPVRNLTTLHDRWRAQREGIAIASPGGGSDHETFLFGFGTPVAEIAFAGPFGPYHSSYDTLRYATAWSDPGFVMHRTAAQLYGIVAMRIAGADALPYAFANYVPALRAGVLRLQARAQRDGRALDLSALAAAIDRFAAAARGADDALARGAGPAEERALAAAQQLDRVAYGANGYASVAYPEIEAAYGRQDAAALRAAVNAAAEAIVRAGGTLR